MAGPCFTFYYKNLADEDYAKIHTLIRGLSCNFFIQDEAIIHFHIKKSETKKRAAGMFIAGRKKTMRFSNMPSFEQDALKESLGFIPKHDFFICAMCNGEAD